MEIFKNGSMGDCPKTKLETQSNTRYSNVNSEQTQNGVESESKSKVFGQTDGGTLLTLIGKSFIMSVLILLVQFNRIK